MEVIYKRQPKGARKPIVERQDRHLFHNCPHCFQQMILHERHPAKLVYIFRCGTYAKLFFKQKTWAENIKQSRHCIDAVIMDKRK